MRVLVIDDSRDTAHLVSVLVEHFGHETKVVTVTKVAVDVARDWQPEFVFVDLAMPDIDGYDMARQLRDFAGLKKRAHLRAQWLHRGPCQAEGRRHRWARAKAD